MSQYKVTSPIKVPMSAFKFRIASVEKQYDNIRVIEGSEEIIFNEPYVYGMLANNRVVKFKKSTLTYK